MLRKRNDLKLIDIGPKAEKYFTNVKILDGKILLVCEFKQNLSEYFISN